MAVSLTDALTGTPSQAATPGYDRDKAGIGIVHLGPGAFHRAHQAVYTDDAMARSGGDWAICGISLRSPGVRDALAPQDGLYTLVTLDEEISYRIIGAEKELMVAPEDPLAVIRKLADPEVKIVTLTITEKGYCLAPDGSLDRDNADIRHDLEKPAMPKSAIGYLVAGLEARRQGGIPPFAAISCDNLPDNGHKLKAAVIGYAGALDPALAEWIEESVAFPRTMVDSITPATDEALIARVRDEAGLEDAWPIQREAFTQWVIEHFDGEKPDWEGAGATFTDDVAAFENAKLRLLNGPHSALAYLGALAGHETVCEAINDQVFEAFLRRMTDAETIPGLTAPEGLDLAAYRDAILKRFRNPAIRHLLSQIAWDGTQKLPVRIIGTIRANLEAGRGIGAHCLVLAGWRLFVMKALEAGREIVDPMAEKLAAEAWVQDGDAVGATERFLAFRAFFDEDLAGNAVLHEKLNLAIDLLGDGAPETVRAALSSWEAET